MANKTVYPYGTGGQLPSSIGIINDLVTGGANVALSAEQGKKLGDVLFKSEIDMEEIPTISAWIAVDKWSTTNSSYKCKLIPVDPLDTYTIYAKQGNQCFYAILTDNAIANNATPAWATGYTQFVEIASGNSAVFQVPANGKYLYISHYSVGDREPLSMYKYSENTEFIKAQGSAFDFSIEDGNGNVILAVNNGRIVTSTFNSGRVNDDLDENEKPVPYIANDNTKPLHLGQVNVIRKALQFCNVEWTPVRGSMPACAPAGYVENSRRYFTAGTTMKGMPYSSPGNAGRAIGSDISLETFMTAVKNPNSVLYTIDLRDTLSGGLVGAYYGLNCSSFTNYVQGIYAVCYGRNNFFGGNRVIEYPKSAEALQIGDVIYLSRDAIDQGHTVVVIGIEKDEYGKISKIKEAEEEGAVAKVYEYTKTAFENRFFNGQGSYPYGSIYRNTRLFENTDFEQAFLGVYDESGEIPYTYSDVLGINIGNNANFNKSDNMPIEITLLQPSNVSSFSLYKGDTLIGTYSTTDGSAGYGDTIIVGIDKSELDTGTYEVRPTSGISQFFCLADQGIVTVQVDEYGNKVITSTGHSNNVIPYGVLLYSNLPLQTTRGMWLMDGAPSATLPAKWLQSIDISVDIEYAQVIYRNEFGNIYGNKIRL